MEKIDPIKAGVIATLLVFAIIMFIVAIRHHNKLLKELEEEDNSDLSHLDYLDCERPGLENWY
jgi:hypothetical protein